MEYVDGMSLRQLIAQESALEPGRALEITGQILQGLSQLHDEGLLHRDIKPDNIMVGGCVVAWLSCGADRPGDR